MHKSSISQSINTDRENIEIITGIEGLESPKKEFYQLVQNLSWLLNNGYSSNNNHNIHLIISQDEVAFLISNRSLNATFNTVNDAALAQTASTLAITDLIFDMRDFPKNEVYEGKMAHTGHCAFIRVSLFELINVVNDLIYKTNAHQDQKFNSLVPIEAAFQNAVIEAPTDNSNLFCEKDFNWILGGGLNSEKVLEFLSENNSEIELRKFLGDSFSPLIDEYDTNNEEEDFYYNHRNQDLNL